MQGLAGRSRAAQAHALGQLRRAQRTRTVCAGRRRGTQPLQVVEGLQVALALGLAEGQHQIFPDAGAERPHGQFLGVLHGQHGDRQAGRAPLDLQQQVEPPAVGMVVVQAEHVRLRLAIEDRQARAGIGQADLAVGGELFDA